MHFVAKLDIEKYSCVAEGITTDEGIITDERIARIEAHHPGDYEKIKPFLPVAIADPDFILEEGEHTATGLVLKQIEVDSLRFQVVIRLHTGQDDPQYKNSIISAWTVSESRWDNYIRNKNILYKKE